MSEELPFTLHECGDAEELFESLRPRRLSQGRHQSPAIYRGQGNALHHLVPRALRCLPPQPADMLVFLELRLLCDFVTACDRAGMALPGDGAAFRASLDNNHGGGVNRAFKQPAYWPLEEHRDVWAVAQHHGLPTRLLDWTRSALVAMYFAAEAALLRERSAEYLAVWSLELEGEPVWRKELGIVEVPASHSPNLAAQSGLFTVLIALAGGRGERLQVVSVEDVIRRGRGQNMRAEYTPLHKYVMKASEAANLLELCELYGVSAATMFPGYDGAARSAVERRARFRIQEGWAERELAEAEPESQAGSS